MRWILGYDHKGRPIFTRWFSKGQYKACYYNHPWKRIDLPGIFTSHKEAQEAAKQEINRTEPPWD